MTTTADDVWRLLAELTAAQKETERLMKEQSREASERHQETERRFQETERRFQETERLMKEQTQETERLWREQTQESERLWRERTQETDRQIRQVNREIDRVSREVRQVSKQIGDLGGKWGRFVENMVAPACETLFLNRGIPVHQVSQRVRKRLEGKTLEIDVMVTNEDHVLAVEVKSSLGVNDVKEFTRALQQFREFFPEYTHKQIYGAVAGIEIEEGADRYAYRQGLFVLAQAGEAVSILNDVNFHPEVGKFLMAEKILNTSRLRIF